MFRLITNGRWLMAMLCLLTVACAPARRTRYKASDTITVTGCVQNSGAKSSATMDGGYLLTATVTGNAENVRPTAPGSLGPAVRDESGGVRETGATAVEHPPSPDHDERDAMARHDSASYMLDGRDSELRNYIDKRAEITGTLEVHRDETSDVNSIPTAGSAIPHGRETGLQWLHVLSVKVISSDCSARR